MIKKKNTKENKKFAGVANIASIANMANLGKAAHAAKRMTKSSISTMSSVVRPMFKADWWRVKRWKSRVSRASGKIESFSVRLSIKDQAFFAKRLAFLANAGVPILDSLKMLQQQTKSRAYSNVINIVIDNVANGQSLSKALSRFPNMFGEFAVSIIKIGETSGTLGKNLEYLAEELKKKQELKRKIIGSMIYPALITVATLGITAFLVVYLFPKIMPIFMSLHMTLPLSTRIIIYVSKFLQHWGVLVLIALVAAIIAWVFTLKHSIKFRKLYHRSLLRIPGIKIIIQQYNIANASRTLGLLLKSGVTLSTALGITAETTNNLVYREQWHAMALVVNRGAQLSSYLRDNGQFFADLVPQMVLVGEQSGNLSNSLIYLAEFYEHEIDDFTKGLASLIEPVLMIFMGLVIGFIAISIITPIYSITQGLHPTP